MEVVRLNTLSKATTKAHPLANTVDILNKEVTPSKEDTAKGHRVIMADRHSKCSTNRVVAPSQRRAEQAAKVV